MENNFSHSEVSSLFSLLLERSEINIIPLLESLSKKLPKNLNYNLVDSLFKQTLEKLEGESFSNTYKHWLTFILKNSKDPFSVDVFSVIKNKKLNKSLTDFISKNWNESIDQKNMHNYISYLDSAYKSTNLELLKFLYETSYNPKIKTKELELNKNEILTTLFLLFEKYYYNSQEKEAIQIMSLFPKNWKTFWNLHLCEPKNITHIDNLISIFKNKNKIIKEQEVLLIQLELKKIIIELETKFDEESEFDKSIVEEIYKELEKDTTHKTTDNQLVSMFTTKLYEKVIYKKAKDIYKRILNTKTKYKSILFIDLKTILEDCELNGITESTKLLNEVNKTLFEEIKDASSGTSFIIQMLKTKNYKGLHNHILKLSYLLEHKSMEMNSFFEAFISSAPSIPENQIKNYMTTFSKILNPYFQLLADFLKVVSDNNYIENFASTIIKNYQFFTNDKEKFYTIMEPIYTGKFRLKEVQIFTSNILQSSIPNELTSSFARLLIDYFYEQPYMELERDFPENINEENIVKTLKAMDDFVYLSIGNIEYEKEFEERQFSMERCKNFLLNINKKEKIREEYENKSF